MVVYVMLLYLLVSVTYFGFFPTSNRDDDDSTECGMMAKIQSRSSKVGDGGINIMQRTISKIEPRFLNDIEEECKTPDKLRGTCIDLTRCNEILRLANMNLYMILHKNGKNILKRYHCGFDGSRPKVCCPIHLSFPTNTVQPPTDSTITKPQASTTTPSSTTSATIQSSTLMDTDIRLPPDVTNHPKLRLLPSVCGDFESNKIFGGSMPDIFDYQWMALLIYRTETSLEFGCGGTIINQRYVLTAAHCLKQRGRTLESVRIGEFNTETDIDCEAGVCASAHTDFGFEKLIMHPQYDRKQMINDIALIRLNANIDFNVHGYPICLPIDSSLRLPKFVGENMTVAGWGATENQQISSVLLHTKLAVIDNAICYGVFDSGMNRKILPTHMCAGGRQGIDSCIGDSGGPLMDMGMVNSIPRYVQHGIVSYGAKKCGTAGIPGVYTRVAYFLDWLLDQLEP